MRAVVTGGAGFIGSNIVDALIAAGDEVLVIDDLSTGLEENLAGARAEGGARLHFEKLDICDAALEGVIGSFAPTHVFHTAAQINVRRSVSEPVFDAERNVVGTVNLLEAARKAAVQTLVFSSTGGAIYGEQEQFPAAESHRTMPECQYGVSKHCAELYLEYYARAYDFTTIALRYANVFGPRQNPKGEAGVVAIFTDRLLAGESLRVNGDGNQTRDFVFVGDVVKANLAVSALNEPGKYFVYNVGRGVETSVLDVVDALREVWSSTTPEGESPSEVVVEFGPELPGEQKRSVIDASKLASEFPWSAETDLESGLHRTVSSFRQAK